MASLSKCPVCGKPVTQENKPFCSRRCKDVDLARWFNGGYSVPDTQSELSDDNGNEDQENYSNLIQ